MNLLEHYIRKIHSIKECHAPWTKEFNYTILEIELTYECYGRISRKKHYWSRTQWDKIKSQGYFMG